MSEPQARARKGTSSPPKQKPAGPAHEPREALRHLEDLVRANPTPEAVQQALAGLLGSGRLSFADLPAVERMLAGIVGAGAQPKSVTPKPRRFSELPEPEQAAWETRIQRDVATLRDKAREWYVSSADEAEICALVERWVAEDERGPFGGTLLDRFILRLSGNTFTKGLLDVTTTTSDELKRRMSDEGRERLVAALRKGKALGRFADDKPPELPSIWKDVVAKTVVGLPGGITSFTGGALQSIPLPYMEEAGDWLHAQGHEYLTTVGYSSDEADAVVAGERMVGRVWGEGMQMVAGVGALGKAAKAGKLAKAGLTGAKAAKYAEATTKAVQIAEDVNAFYKEHKTLIDTSVKVVTDIIGSVAAGKELTADRVFEMAYTRVLKEVFSKLGEGDDSEYKKAEGDLYKEASADRRGSSDASRQADRHEAHADRLRDRSDEMREQGKRGHAGPANLAGYMDRQADLEREKSKSLSKASRRKLAAYVLRNVFRRFIVNAMQTLVVEYRRAQDKTGVSGGRAWDEMRRRGPEILKKIAVSTVREVVTDLLVNIILVDLGMLAKSVDVAREAMKLCVDGVTKVILGLLTEGIDAAFPTK